HDSASYRWHRPLSEETNECLRNGSFSRLHESPPRRCTDLQKDGSMSNTATETLSVVVEREISYPPEKIWRALTQPHLIEEWLMKNDFKPVVDHRFNLRADWGAVACQVLAVEPNKTLSYTWAAYGLESVVTWTLTPTSAGTHL